MCFFLKDPIEKLIHGYLVNSTKRLTQCILRLHPFKTLLEKAKLVREISDGKNEIPHKFLGRKI